jgi:hypothetical protein
MTDPFKDSINPEDMLNEIIELRSRVKTLETMTARLLVYVKNTGNLECVQLAGLDEKSVIEALTP